MKEVNLLKSYINKITYLITDENKDYISPIIKMMEMDIADRIHSDLIRQEILDKKYNPECHSLKYLESKGYIGTSTEFHSVLGEWTGGNIDTCDVRGILSDTSLNELLISSAMNKGTHEMVMASVYAFDPITHTTGHDGYRRSTNQHIEIKHQLYNDNKGRFNPTLIFDRVSSGNLKKLDDGRPLIYYSAMTSTGKRLIDLEIEFTDELIALYKTKMDNIKGKTSTGITFSFSDFEHAILNIPHLHDDFHMYSFGINFNEYLNESVGTDFCTKRKSKQIKTELSCF